MYGALTDPPPMKYPKEALPTDAIADLERDNGPFATAVAVSFR